MEKNYFDFFFCNIEFNVIAKTVKFQKNLLKFIVYVMQTWNYIYANKIFWQLEIPFLQNFKLPKKSWNVPNYVRNFLAKKNNPVTKESHHDFRNKNRTTNQNHDTNSSNYFGKGHFKKTANVLVWQGMRNFF